MRILWGGGEKTVSIGWWLLDLQVLHGPRNKNRCGLGIVEEGLEYMSLLRRKEESKQKMNLYYKTWLAKQYENGRESKTCCIYGCMSLAVHSQFEDCGEKRKWLYYCPKHWREVCEAAEAAKGEE